MRFIVTLTVVIISLAVILAGCGGSRNPSTWVAPDSPFMGFWIGTWTDSTNAQSGTAQIVINKDGDASGTITNTTLGIQGTVSGSINEHGVTSFTCRYPSNTYSDRGTLLIGDSGHLVGLLREYEGETQCGTLALDLTKQ